MRLKTRHYKFRAYDFGQRKFLQPFKLSLNQKDSDFAISQFSGYYDSEENEIYEGDVVEVVEEHQEHLLQIKAGEINTCICVFKEGEVLLIPIKSEIFYYSVKDVAKNKKSRVIGNVYQNPDYLDKVTNRLILSEIE